jgi:diguanylate cyclase (GGDEF)-like protein
LIGREEEFEKVKSLFHDAKQGSGKICLVAGESGAGKSRLVDEIRNFVYEQGGLFIGGRCLNQENKIPYQPFKDAIDVYIRNILKMENESKHNEINRIKSVLGDLGEILVRLNPNMKNILGEVKELVALDSDRENQRFLMVLSDFFCNLTKKGKLSVLYLDDLQWVDEGSISLMAELASKVENSNLLVLGTYRNNEVDEHHVLQKFRGNIKEKGYIIDEISLGHFDHEKLNKLVSSILGQKEENSHNITRYILEKTGGNPFFAINILRELVEEKAITWSEGLWEENWEKIKSMPMSYNMVDVILKRVKDLPDDLNNVLCIGAVIGREFEIDLLYRLVDNIQDDIIRVVDDAIALQLIEESPQKGKVLFVHDRIRDAFSNRRTDVQKQKLHIRIAEVIEELNKDNINGVIFDLAHHYVEGGDQTESLKYVIPAADKAKSFYANEVAIRYYNIGIKMLEYQDLTKSEEWIKAMEGLVDVYLTVGKNDEAIGITEQLLELDDKSVDKVDLYKKIGTAYFKKGDWSDCENNLEKGLQILGEGIPKSSLNVGIRLFKELSIHILHNIFPSVFHHKASKPTNEKYRDVVSLYLALSWMYLLCDEKKFVCSVLRMLNIAEAKLGKSKELGAALGMYGSLCMAIPLFSRSVRYQEKAIKLRDDMGDEWGVAQCLQWLGFCYSWMSEYEKSIEIYSQSRDRFQKIGDVWEQGMVQVGLGNNNRYQGRYDVAIEEYSRYLHISQKIGDDYGASTSLSNIGICYRGKGDFEKAEEYLKRALELTQKKEIWFINCYSYIDYGYLAMERGNFENAVRCLETARELYEKYKFVKDYSIYVYSYLAEAYVEEYRSKYYNLNVQESYKQLKKIKGACKEALRQTKAWPNHYGSALKAVAKYYALIKQNKKAKRYFLKCIEQTKASGHKVELAKGYYEYGNFLVSLENIELAKYYWNLAYTAFQDIQSEHYIKKCSELLGYKMEKQQEDNKTMTNQDRLSLDRRMSTVLATGRYLSSILDLEELLEKIMDAAIELIGAERGVILLYNEQGGGGLELVTARNVTKEEGDNKQSIISKSIISKVESERVSLVIDDAVADETLRTQNSVVMQGLRSVLCSPITVKGEMIGILYLDNRMVRGVFREEDLQVLTSLASQAGISIENARLYTKAVTDGLTGLYNRAFFDNFLMKSVSSAHRHKTKLSLLIMDVDHFKKFNDTYGHQAGDDVLKSVAKIWKESVREGDVACRYGGEEFVLILPETNIEGANTVAEKIRQTVENNRVHYLKDGEEIELRVTISIGVAELKDGQDRMRLIERADNALYKAKESGRNRVYNAE